MQAGCIKPRGFATAWKAQSLPECCRAAFTLPADGRAGVGCAGERPRVVDPDGGFGAGREEGASAAWSQAPCGCASPALCLQTRAASSESPSPAQKGCSVCQLSYVTPNPSLPAYFSFRKNPELHFLYSSGFCPTLLCAVYCLGVPVLVIVVEPVRRRITDPLLPGVRFNFVM